MKNQFVIKVPSLQVLVSGLLGIYGLSMVGFGLFGILYKHLYVFNPYFLEDRIRFWSGLAVFAVSFFSWQFERISALLVPLVFAGHFFATDLMLWAFNKPHGRWLKFFNLESAGSMPTGYQTAYWIGGVSISLALALTLVIFRVQLVSFFKVLVSAWRAQSAKSAEGFRSASFGALILSVLAATHLFALFISYFAGLALKINSFSWSTINDKFLWIIGIGLLLLGLQKPWAKSTAVTASITLILSKYFLTPLVDGIVFTWTDAYMPWNMLAKVNLAYDLEDEKWRSLVPYETLSTTLGVAQDFTIFAMVLTLFGIALATSISRYRRAIMAWSDKRSDEVFGPGSSQVVTAPRAMSILAVMSLIFAFVFPLVGLILAYSARNEIVHSRGNKQGMELTVASAIISWFGIVLYGLLIGLFALLPMIGIANPFDVWISAF